MKQIIPIIVLAFLFGCGTSKQTSTTSQNNTTPTSFRDSSENISSIILPDTFNIVKPKPNPFYNVKITITKYIPYCGGAAPTQEQMSNYQPAVGEFILVNHTKGKKSTVQTNSKGIIHIKLPLGEYSLRETYKNMNFKQFYAKELSKGSKNTKNGTKECYENWWKTNLVDFKINDIKDTLKFSANIYQSCFTGVNPCFTYTGPYPP